MDSIQRREALVRILSNTDEPLSGAELAKRFQVTRQIIVRDIAILKAEKFRIISTMRGYYMQKDRENTIKRLITVKHEVDRIEEELQLIVDLGGKVLTTAVEHPFYGEVEEDINIKSKKDIKNFLNKISDTGCEPLLRLTKGVHRHLIEAEDSATLDEIVQELKDKGFYYEN
ncbi:MAG: transcription repressor NadR [Clostridiales bacterium]|nr:transcription repressor NadR [Clostridiales bacterium]